MSRKTKKLTARQMKQKTLTRAIDTILQGGNASLQGISIIKSKRDQNLLRRALDSAVGSGMSPTDFKRIYGLNNNFGGMSKRSLKTTNSALDSGREKVQAVTRLRARELLRSSKGPNLGDPVADIIELLGYDWDQINTHDLYMRLENEDLKRTSMAELLEGHYEKAYPWIVSFIADHITEYLRDDQEYKDMDDTNYDMDDDTML